MSFTYPLLSQHHPCYLHRNPCRVYALQPHLLLVPDQLSTMHFFLSHRMNTSWNQLAYHHPQHCLNMRSDIILLAQWAYKVQYFLGSTEEKGIFYILNQEKQRFAKVHVIIHSIKQNNFLLLNLWDTVFSQTFNIMPWCSKYCCSHACFTMFNPSNKSYISSHNSKVHNMFYNCVVVIVSTEDLKEAVKTNDW